MTTRSNPDGSTTKIDAAWQTQSLIVCRIREVSMNPEKGDHICCVYSSPSELATIAGEFIAGGLERRHQCWYVASGDEARLVRAELRRRGIDVDGEMQRGALRLITGSGTYRIRGAFDPEHSIQVFNDAIEEAYSSGFTGFRAAADMSWALDLADGPSQLIVYEALLRSLFAHCRATGLCLYDRHRMPLDVIDGALATHPKVRSPHGYRHNVFYDPARTGLTASPEPAVLRKLSALERPDLDR